MPRTNTRRGPRGYYPGRSSRRGIDPERLTLVLNAVDRGALTRAEAEQALGFLQLVEGGGPLPSRTTWYRRTLLLMRAGVAVPALPRALS